MNKEETLALYKKGREAWNAWAKEMLDQQIKLKETGQWLVSNGPRILGGENHVTQLWFATAMADFSKHAFETDICFSDFVFPGDAKFTKTEFANATSFAGAKFRGNAQFEGATFNGIAGFEGAEFSSRAEFWGTIFSDNAWFEGATFNGIAGFEGAKFRGNAEFKGAEFSGDAWFERTTFSYGAEFEGAKFSGEGKFWAATFNNYAWFKGAMFNSDAWFEEATFSDYAEFEGGTFNGATRFEGAKFSYRVGFAGATFNGYAGFSRATFSHYAGFSRATFSGNARFEGATFSSDAEFQGATFSSDAEFQGATFSGNARFEGATFSSDTEFQGATFSSDAEFQGATFSSYVRFKGTTFWGSAGFNQTTFESFADFSGTIFQKEANFIAIKGQSLFTLKNVRFLSVPNFEQAHFAEAPRLDHLSVQASGNEPDIAARWRTLRRLATQGHDHERELIFLAEEIKALREVQDWLLPNPLSFRKGEPICWPGGGRYWFGLFYQWFSDFGRSTFRPFLWWMVVMGLFALFYFHYSATPNLSNSSKTTLAIGAPICDPPIDALYLSIHNGLVISGLGRGEKLAQTYACLYGNSGKNQLIPIMPNTVVLAGIAQTILSAVLIFLFLLGLRNYFRIK